MKEKIKTWYALGLWNENMVQKAEEKGILTKKEAEEIIKSKGEITWNT